MIDMIRRQRSEREKRREDLFEKFGKVMKKVEGKPSEKILEPIRKEKIIEKAKQAVKTKEEIRKPAEKALFERLSEVSKKEKLDVERLTRLGEKKSIDELGRLGKREDVFKKLPTSKKGIEDLSELEKRKKRRK